VQQIIAQLLRCVRGGELECDMHWQAVRRLGLERDPHDSTPHGWQDLARLHKHEHVNVALAPELTTCIGPEQHHAVDAVQHLGLRGQHL